MQNFDASNVDVLIVYKKSALERYTSSGIQEFLQKTDEGSLAGSFRLQQAHNNNQSCIKFVETELTKKGISFLSLSLDNFFEQNPEFFNPLEGTISGVRPNLRLVISIGGDGTLLNVSHFVGSDICLLGVNSNPQTSVGFLCAAETSNFNLIFEKFLNNELSVRHVWRIQVCSTNLKSKLPLSLNDLLFCHVHPAAASRYKLYLNSESTSQKQGFDYVSSGLWVATSAGSTAAISSYHLGPLEIESCKAGFATREPYTNLKTTACSAPLKGVLNPTPDTAFLSFVSQMRHGQICIDGLRAQYSMELGEKVDLELPRLGKLKLV